VSRARVEADPRGLGSLPVYLLLRALTFVACWTPRPLVEAGARAAAWVADIALRRSEARQNRRGRGVLRNIEIAFGEALSPEERRALARRYTLHLTRLVFEVLRLPRLRSEADVAARVDFSEIDHLLRDREQPLIVATGHFGNWEVMAYAGAVRGSPTRSLGRPLPWAGLQRWLRELRARAGSDFRSKFRGTPEAKELSGIRSLKQALSEGQIVGLNIDEDVRRGGTFVQFCGVQASTHASAALLQRASGAKIMVVTCQRVGVERFKVHLWDLIEPDPSLDADAERERVCGRIAAGFEQALRTYPDQWLWTLRRWKTRPPNEGAGESTANAGASNSATEGRPHRLPPRLEPARAPEALPPLRPSWTLRLALSVAALLALAVTTFSLGPRRVADPSLLEVRLQSQEPAQIARELAAREAAIGDVDSACAARVVFADPESPAKTPVAIVYVHGFSATRQETAPLAEDLARSLGANLFEARLRGHGRPGAALGAARTEEWLSDAAEAIEVGRRLGEQVVVLSCSTGSSLVAWLLSHGHAERVAASVWISPNFEPRAWSSRLLTGPWGARICALAVGPERSWTPGSELHARYWTHRYPSQVLIEMQATVDLAQAAELGEHRTPLLMIYSPRDRILSPAAMEARYAEVGAAHKDRQAFLDDEDPSHHVLAGDVLSPASTPVLEGRIRSFLKPLLEGSLGEAR
jgi:lauroyl/myristoyl acyltransferase/esterase/lipase